jgi:phospholipid transport system substrate-binding protein
MTLQILLVACVPALALAAPSGAMTTLKQKNGEVDRLLRQKVEKGSPAEQKQKDDVKKLAASLLDYDELGKRAMAQHWDKLSPAQQKEFISTLRGLIERNYVKQLKTNLDYQVVYKGEDPDGSESVVTTLVKVKTSGTTNDAEVVYKMHKLADGSWRVFDIVTDEVSLVRNYKTQFNKIITEQSYDALIKKMKSKLAEEAG